MFCVYCGKELEENTKFCPYCGQAAEGEPGKTGDAVFAEKKEKAAGGRRRILIAAGAVAAIAVIAGAVTLFRFRYTDEKALTAYGDFYRDFNDRHNWDEEIEPHGGADCAGRILMGPDKKLMMSVVDNTDADGGLCNIYLYSYEKGEVHECAALKRYPTPYDITFTVIDDDLYLFDREPAEENEGAWQDLVYRWDPKKERLDRVKWEESDEDDDEEGIYVETEREGTDSEDYGGRYGDGLYVNEQGVDSERMRMLLGLDIEGMLSGSFSASRIHGSYFEDVVDGLIDNVGEVRAAKGDPVKFDQLYAHVFVDEVGYDTDGEPPVVAILEDSDGYYGIGYDGDASLFGVKRGEKKIDLPSKVSGCPLTEIVGDMSCPAVEKLTVPEGVTDVSLGECPKLTELELPKDLKAFAIGSCKALEELTIPDGVKKVALGECPKLTKLELADGVKELAVDSCTALEELLLPDGVETVWLGECPKLTKLEVPKSLLDLEENLTLVGAPEYDGSRSLDKCLVIFCTEDSDAYEYVEEHMLPYVVGSIEKNGNDKPVFDETEYLVKKKALPAYAEYMQNCEDYGIDNENGGSYDIDIDSFAFMYVNGDDIPELYFLNEWGGIYGLATYCTSTDEVKLCLLNDLSLSYIGYREKEGILYYYAKHNTSLFTEAFYRLSEDGSSCEEIASAERWEDYDMDSDEYTWEYFIDGDTVSEKECDAFGKKYGELKDVPDLYAAVSLDETTLAEIYDNMKK